MAHTNPTSGLYASELLAGTRRRFLGQIGGGFAAIALADMLAGDAKAQAAANPSFNGGLHHPAKAKRVIELFMNGGVSQMDTFDYKPELERKHGQKVDFGIKAAVTSIPGAVMKSPFAFKQYGQTGRWVSSVLPNLAE